MAQPFLLSVSKLAEPAFLPPHYVNDFFFFWAQHGTFLPRGFDY